LAIDDSTYERLQVEMRKRGCSFRQIVNESLSQGLDRMQRSHQPRRFVVRPFPTGPRPGISFDSVNALLDDLEGPERR